MAKKNKLMPFGGKILVQRIEEQVKKNGIIIPDSTKEKPQQGKIIEISPSPCNVTQENGRKTKEESKQYEPCPEKGDVILFGKFAGTEIEFEGEEFIIIDSSEILAIIK